MHPCIHPCIHASMHASIHPCMHTYIYRLGTHTRAVITDVRPKLFDGAWKENVGGGDYLIFFDGDGRFQYKKQLDAQLRANGPCLSNVTYTSVTGDDKIKSVIQVSGGRTDGIHTYIHTYIYIYICVYIESIHSIAFIHPSIHPLV